MPGWRRGRQGVLSRGALAPRRSTAPTHKYPEARWALTIYAFIPESCHPMIKTRLYGLKRKRCAGSRQQKRAKAPELQPAAGPRCCLYPSPPS